MGENTEIVEIRKQLSELGSQEFQGPITVLEKAIEEAVKANKEKIEELKRVENENDRKIIRWQIEKGKEEILSLKRSLVKMVSSFVEFLRKIGEDERAKEEDLKLRELYQEPEMRLEYNYPLIMLDCFLDPGQGREKLKKLAQLYQGDIIPALRVRQAFQFYEQYSIVERMWTDLGNEEKVKEVIGAKVNLFEALVEETECPALASDYEKLGEEEKAKEAFSKKAQKLEEEYEQIRAKESNVREFSGVGFQLASSLKKSGQTEKARKILEQLGDLASLQKDDTITLTCFARLRDKEVTRRILEQIIEEVREQKPEEQNIMTLVDTLVNLSWLNQDPALSREAKDLCLDWVAKADTSDNLSRTQSLLAYQKALQILEGEESELKHVWEEDGIDPE